MVIRDFHTPAGIIERALTLDEITQLAGMGDTECKLELLKNFLAAITPTAPTATANQVALLISFLTT
jgi:hypothetical protein